jgi:plastocyanin
MTTYTEPPSVNGHKADATAGVGIPDTEPLEVRVETSEEERVWRDWMMVGLGLTALLSILATIVAVVALASKSPTPAATTQQAAQPASQGTALPVAPPQAVNILVKSDTEHGRLGPDGKWHDAFLPADFTVRAGHTVKVTLTNYDSGPHTFTSPAMGVNETIPGGGSLGAPRQVTFTFKAPTKPGKYAWWCAVPCDPWAMSHDGYMRGYVTVKA